MSCRRGGRPRPPAPPCLVPAEYITTQTRFELYIMDWRNRIGLYGSYFLGMAAIGFTLPYLPLYLGEKGFPTGDRDRLDAGGAVRPGPVSGRALV